MKFRSSYPPAIAFALAGAFGIEASGAPAPPPAANDVAPSAWSSAIQRRETMIDDSGIYRQEVRACREGRTQQALADCLKEARNAHAARLRGNLGATSHDYKANALARCRPFSGEQKAVCEARVMGFGTSSGSIEGGGVLHTVETVVLPPADRPIVVFPRTDQAVVVAPPR